MNALRRRTAESLDCNSLMVLDVLLSRFVNSGFTRATFVADGGWWMVDDGLGNPGVAWWKLFAPSSLMAVTGSRLVDFMESRRAFSSPKCQKNHAKTKQVRLTMNHVRVFKCIG